MGATSLELLRALPGGLNHPVAPAWDDSKDQKDQADPGIETNALDLKIRELPDSPVGTDDQSIVVATDPEKGPI